MSCSNNTIFIIHSEEILFSFGEKFSLSEYSVCLSSCIFRFPAEVLYYSFQHWNTHSAGVLTEWLNLPPWYIGSAEKLFAIYIAERGNTSKNIPQVIYQRCYHGQWLYFSAKQNGRNGSEWQEDFWLLFGNINLWLFFFAKHVICRNSRNTAEIAWKALMERIPGLILYQMMWLYQNFIMSSRSLETNVAWCVQ